MPGVNVVTATRTGRSAPVLAPSGQLFIAGLASQGDITQPILCNSLSDFETMFGGRVSYSTLHDVVQSFFEEGGTQAWVCRAYHGTPTYGAYSLLDGSAGTSIILTAKWVGAYSSNIQIVVSFASPTTTVTISYNGVTVETWVGTSQATLLAAMQSSAYVTATAGGSTLIPAPVTASLTAGTDGYASAVAADYITAINLCDKSLGDGSVAIPGVGTTVHAGLISHASTNNRIALLDMPNSSLVTDLTTQAATLNSEFAGLFAPWVNITTTTGTYAIPPVGYIAAVRNRAIEQAGNFRAAAGELSVARFIVGVATSYNRTNGDALDAGKVNAIRIINNTVRNYGWRSLSNDTANYSLLTGRDVLNRIVTQCNAELEQFVFRTIDSSGHLLSKINSVLCGVIEPMRQAGGLFALFDGNGKQIDPGYLVETGSNINTLASLNTNTVKAKLSLRVAPTAALVSVTVIKVGLISGL